MKTNTKHQQQIRTGHAWTFGPGCSDHHVSFDGRKCRGIIKNFQLIINGCNHRRRTHSTASAAPSIVAVAVPTAAATPTGTATLAEQLKYQWLLRCAYTPVRMKRNRERGAVFERAPWRKWRHRERQRKHVTENRRKSKCSGTICCNRYDNI